MSVQNKNKQIKQVSEDLDIEKLEILSSIM